MSIVNPSILPGFMELLPDEQVIFDKMKNIIENNFKKHGFVNLDTPLIEKEEILLSKGGGETSKQIYRIDKESTPQALRFDLTVSLARYVAMRENDLTFPFKRYQIGKVYRGERNQKGRYREFYQCDIDIIGNSKLSVINDAQLPAIMYKIFDEFGIPNITFRVNNRKLLGGFLSSKGIDNFENVLRTIDKLEKIGIEKTKTELEGCGITQNSVEEIFEFINDRNSTVDTFNFLESLEIDSEDFRTGLLELQDLYKFMKLFGVPTENIKIDLTITRGLDYYTGNVFETVLNGYETIGSICSGGRYDNLSNNFTKNNYPGVGMSIGLTRLFYQLNEANLLDTLKSNLDEKILILPMDTDVLEYSIEVYNKLVASGILTDIYLEEAKTKKKFNFADKAKFNKVLIIGENEKNNNQVTIKNFKTGEQKLVELENIINHIYGGN